MAHTIPQPLVAANTAVRDGEIALSAAATQKIKNIEHAAKYRAANALAIAPNNDFGLLSSIPRFYPAGGEEGSLKPTVISSPASSPIQCWYDRRAQFPIDLAVDRRMIASHCSHHGPP
jgi:hypothetical protein